MTLGSAAVLVTTEKLYRKRVAPWRDQLPTLRHVLLIGEVADPPEDTRVLAELMAEAPDTLPDSVNTAPEDWALLHFTSGTTGHPKGAIHVHDAVVCHHITGQYALDLHPDDVFWCTADPGWVTGTSYGMIAPLTNGVTLVVDEGEFDAERWYEILAEERVSVWYTAPTAIRMLMKYGIEPVKRNDLSALRFMASVGEPLNPEAVLWGLEAFGMPFHDNWWQTETGGIMVANYPAMPIKPGSMGRPLPGIEAAVMTRDKQGNARPVATNATGELALKAGWPSMFRGYLNREDKYRHAFAGEWYFTEDLARQDEDGYIWFVGRADDVIKTAGHLVGPFEVESVLMENPAVAEAGVIGIPDEVSGQAIKAFVALKPGYEGGEDLRKVLMAHARRRLGASIAPKSLEFRASLPKTRSGKIMRRLLKARELGEPEGDISTLEVDA
jgi:acetyl-CoA synthetase